MSGIPPIAGKFRRHASVDKVLFLAKLVSTVRLAKNEGGSSSESGSHFVDVVVYSLCGLD